MTATSHIVEWRRRIRQRREIVELATVEREDRFVRQGTLGFIVMPVVCINEQWYR